MLFKTHTHTQEQRLCSNSRQWLHNWKERCWIKETLWIAKIELLNHFSLSLRYTSMYTISRILRPCWVQKTVKPNIRCHRWKELCIWNEQLPLSSRNLATWMHFIWGDASGLIRAWLWEKEQDDPHSYSGDTFTHELPKKNGSCFRTLAACPRSWPSGCCDSVCRAHFQHGLQSEQQGWVPHPSDF